MPTTTNSRETLQNVLTAASRCFTPQKGARRLRVGSVLTVSITYIVIVTLFVCMIIGVLHKGNSEFRMIRSETLSNQLKSSSITAASTPLEMWRIHATAPVAIVSVQVILILLVGRVLVALASRIRQPSVIGEVAAGIVLGPSFLGAHWPKVSSWLFSVQSINMLQLLSQLGIILYMFGIGMDVNWNTIRRQVHGAALVSHTSILVPFLLGVITGIPLFPKWASAGVSFQEFALFIGVAMSITAFPVLARILAERGISTTPLGSLALTCAAVDDATAWLLLAFVTSIASGKSAVANIATTLALLLILTATMFFVVRPLLGGLCRLGTSGDVMAVVVMFGAAFATQVMGVHPVFGAFLAGTIMPESSRKLLRERLEGISSVVLLPLFFVLTGLRTHIGSLDSAESWITLVSLISIATIGKLGSSTLAARFVGLSWNAAFTLGALMNTRGLMELIALNVAYDLGVISPGLFTCFVLMALITTAMTGPFIESAVYFASRNGIPSAMPARTPIVSEQSPVGE